MSKIKEQIIKANESYRNGYPIMTDSEYDVLLSKLEDQMNFIEFESFKKTLMEKSGEYKHLYIMGSLNKVRYGTDELTKWIKKYKVKSIIVSEKLDGCSFTARYVDGKFYDGASRGDGISGTDWTEKLKYILPQNISAKDTLVIRGELMLCDDAHIELGYKNPRNGVTGIMGEDAIVPEKLKKVTAFVYDVLNTDYKPFTILNSLKDHFDVPNFRKIVITDTIEEDLKEQLELWKNNSNYLMDGLVICTEDYMNENVHHPEKKIAFKVNSEGVKSIVTGIEWNVGKTGAVKPVVTLEPIEIDGTTVSRATGYNYRFISDNCIGIGSEVSIIKSGEIIPKIINVLKKSELIEVPSVCPCCSSLLTSTSTSVDLICENVNCSDQVILKLNSFLRDCGVENASEASLKKWGIVTFTDLLNFKANSKYKSQISFEKELEKVFNKSALELFSKFYFNGAGEKTINKILEHWKITDQEHVDFLIEKPISNYIIDACSIGFPEGIGETTLSKLASDWEYNKSLLKMIIEDVRYKPVIKQKSIIKESNITDKVFCITGTLSKSRKYFENIILENGGKLGSVNKNLDYLVVGSDAGSKLDKAKKLGLNIISEQDFLKII